MALVLWWSPWSEEAETQPPSSDPTGFTSTRCEDIYFDEFGSVYLDDKGVRDIPGCAGFLPPPPEMLPGYDQDCDDIAGGPVRVGPYDRYGLDADGDGIGCEWNE